MQFSFEDLQFFVTVARAGSFNRAARLLHTTQPTVSERIARLERQVAAQLFVRGARGTTLTMAGRRLLPYARRCLSLADEALTAVKANDADDIFRVLMHATFAPSIMPFVLDAIGHLPLEIGNNDAHSEDVVRYVSDGIADVGFIVPVPHPHNLTVEPFSLDPVVCVVSPDHPLASRAQLTVSDLANHLVAVNPWGEGADDFIDMLRSAPIQATSFRQVSPAETAAALAHLRGHVGVLTRSTVAWELGAGILVELPVSDLPPWVVTVLMVYRTNDAETPTIQALRNAAAAGTDPVERLAPPRET